MGGFDLTAVNSNSTTGCNGAHALRCADTVGSHEPSKSADVLILNISDYELAHHFGINRVHTTIKRGEIMWEQGKVGPRPVEYPQPSW